jgi:hypothetical protein
VHPLHCEPAAHPLRIRCASAAHPLRIRCASAAHPLRIRCAAGTQAARWLKWGKTGNHLFPGGRSTHTLSLTQRACSSPAAHQKIYSFGEKIPVFKQSHPAASSSTALPPCCQLPPATPSRRQAPPSSSSSRRERARSPQAAPAASTPRPSDTERTSGRVRHRRQPGGLVIYHGSDSKATRGDRPALPQEETSCYFEQAMAPS